LKAILVFSTPERLLENMGKFKGKFKALKVDQEDNTIRSGKPYLLGRLTFLFTNQCETKFAVIDDMKGIYLKI
jgi:hypothetical protein